MAGLFGFMDVTRPGKGVNKNGPEKKRFFLFLEIYFRKLWKLIQLNFLYVLCCIPVVTIGPATVALSSVLKQYALQRPSFMFADFVKSFRQNFKSGFVVGIIHLLLLGVLGYSALSYWNASEGNKIFIVPLAIMIMFLLLVFVMGFYVYLLLATVELPLKAVFKNAFLLTFVGIKTNLITLLFHGVLWFLMVAFFPYTILVALVVFFSTIQLLSIFNSYQYVEKYIIKPFYQQTGEKRPDAIYMPEEEPEEKSVFTDIGTKEVRQKRSGGQTSYKKTIR